MNTTLQVNQVVFGLLPGVLGASAARMGVWVQGCSLRKCPGCLSPHTWDPVGGRVVAVETLIAMAKAQPLQPTGLTISGGEPSDQPHAVAALIDAFRAAYPENEIVLYSGLSWAALTKRHPMLAARPDVAITGRFVRRFETTPLAGSANQEVRLLTPLAARLYRDWERWPRHRLQVTAAGAERVVTVGIPDSRRMSMAMKRLAADLAASPDRSHDNC